MINGKRVLVVVPARGGSKGVPMKNIRPVNGVPLVALTGRVVKELDFVDRAVVSTDHPEIARIAGGAGLDAPFERPAELSGDLIGDVDVLLHALRETERREAVRYDIIVMLQPTSPLRTAAQVRATVEKLVDGGFDSVWTVSETDVKFHPLKQVVLEGDRLGYFDPRGRNVIARQQLGKVYHRNGVAYALTRDCLIKQKSLMGAKAGAVVIHEPVANIDTAADFEKLERKA